MFTALLCLAVSPGRPARPGFIGPGSPFNFIQRTRLLKYRSKCAFLLLLPCIILCAQALLFLWVIPLSTFTAPGFSDLDNEMAAVKSIRIFRNAWSETEARNISGYETCL